MKKAPPCPDALAHLKSCPTLAAGIKELLPPPAACTGSSLNWHVLLHTPIPSCTPGIPRIKAAGFRTWNCPQANPTNCAGVDLSWPPWLPCARPWCSAQHQDLAPSIPVPTQTQASPSWSRRLCPRPQSCPMPWGSLRSCILKGLLETAGQTFLRCWVLVSSHPGADNQLTVSIGTRAVPNQVPDLGLSRS